MKNIKPLCLGILGAANIARQFTQAVRSSPHVNVVAVACGRRSSRQVVREDAGEGAARRPTQNVAPALP
jgi:hypothetical protein